MSKESKAVLYLKPNQLRLLTKVHPQTLMNSVSKEQEKSINYYDDSLLNTTYPELYEKLNLADIRYLWSLLRSFNKYLAPSGSFGSHNAPVVQGVNSSVPLTFSAYMSFTRNLGLVTNISQVYVRRFVAQLVSMNVKFDLRHLILEKTAVQREHAPRLYFERLKLAHRNREYEENGEEGGINASPKRESNMASSNAQESGSGARKD